MKTLTEQSISQSFREQLHSYSEDYPTQELCGGVYPTEDAISAMSSWIDNEFREDNSEDKGTIQEWENICIDDFIDILELKDGDCNETNSVLNYINENM